MIHYTLTCDRDHQFDSWFQSSAAYEKLRDAGQVACVTCGSSKVRRSPMAPSIARGGADPAPTLDGAPTSDAEKAMAALRRQVEENVPLAEAIWGMQATYIRHQEETLLDGSFVGGTDRKAVAAAACLLLASVGGGPASTLHRPVGCKRCNHTGYRGRTSILETLTLDDGLRRAVLRGTDASELHREAVASGLRTLYHDGLAKALAGTTSIDEVLRATRDT